MCTQTRGLCLTEHMILNKIRSNSLMTIRQLNFWGFNLSDVHILEKMPNLQVVALSINNITTLQPFANCDQLRELHLRRNLISTFDELRWLMDLPDLRKLALAENPICADPSYRNKVIRMLPQLDELDGIPIQDPWTDEPQPAPKSIAAVTEDRDDTRFLAAVLALLPSLSADSISIVRSSIETLGK